MRSEGWRNGDRKGILLPFLIIMQNYESVLCSSSLHLFDKKTKKHNIVKYYYNLKECLSIILIYFKI